MSGIEWRGMTPEEMIREIEDSVQKYRENKYAFQVGLKDLDFYVDEDKIASLGLALPFQNINQAETALRARVITPTKFLEFDETEHTVAHFDPRPVGYSGFMDCVTHSLALTNHGLFNVGRYPAISLHEQNRFWQWFLHRRFVTIEEINNFWEREGLTAEHCINSMYQALVGE